MVKINVDGQEYDVDPTKTVFEIADECGTPIPCLCGIDGFDDCGLCDVEVLGDGILNAHQCFPIAGMTIATQSTALSVRRQQRLKTLLSLKHVNCSVPPCQTACPAHVDIQSYLYYIAKKDYLKAIETIKKTLPMPLSIGRVCPAFCEAKCQRNLVDGPIAIRQLKRYAADLDLKAIEAYTPARKNDKNKHIAIVGGGPGGLSCGYYLSNEGYDVTVFESMSKAGGWLRYGIPEYRLPKDILDKEIELLCRNGMTIKTEQTLGKDWTLSQLSHDFDAVCLAVGASQASPMHYQGSDLAGCYLGVDYLKDQATDQLLVLGKKVAIIGGGNTAIDCARTAIRTGADTTLIYRRTKDEMPAEDYEIAEAEHEGVQFLFLTNPVENKADENGRVCRVKLEKMALGEPDASGRCSPKATGEFEWIEFDTVIAAVSQKTQLDFLEDDPLTLPLSRWHTFDVNDTTMHTGVENIFAIGDARRGPATAIEAIADGRKAAQAIDDIFGGNMERLYLNSFRPTHLSKGQFIRPDHREKLAAAIRTVVSTKDDSEFEANMALAMQKILRAKMPELTQAQRYLSFDEVETGLIQHNAVAEAKRCLSCGCFEGNDCKLRHYATDYHVKEIYTMPS
jgi:formate dehydrogenase major subunit